MSTYLVALVVADYECIDNQIDMQNIIEHLAVNSDFNWKQYLEENV